MDPQRNEMEGGAAAYEQESRMEGGAAEEVIPIPKPTECERAVAFVKELQNNIQPVNETENIVFDFVKNVDIEIDDSDQIKEEDIGKIKRIINGSYRGTNLDDVNFTTIDYNDGTELSRLLRLNLNGQNSFGEISLKPNGSISAYNFNLSTDRILWSINCDAERKCTCFFTEDPITEVIKPPADFMRAVTKTG